MPKFIREARFGPPKCWKTGSILVSYPKPMLVLMFDRGGHEIHRNPADIEHILPATFKDVLVPDRVLKPITVLDLSFKASTNMETAYSPAKDEDVFAQTVNTINLLRGTGAKLPFKTILVDPVTELSDAIWRHQAVLNTAALSDARKWAGNIGMKVGQVIGYVNALPTNTVFVFHTETNTDEETKKVTEQPMVYSKLRNYLGGLFSQFFYQHDWVGKPTLRTKSFDLVQGIGARWPANLPEFIEPPTFDKIYGKEPDVYK